MKIDLKKFFSQKKLFYGGEPTEESRAKESTGEFRAKLGKVRTNKKILVPLAIFFLSVAGGFFYYWLFYETPPEKWEEAGYSQQEDYILKETAEGKIIDNRKAGLKFKVPDGWRLERPSYSDYLVLYSPEAKGSAKEGKIEKGCEIIVEIMDIKTSVEAIEKRLRYLHQEWGPEEYELLEVSGKKGLKNIAAIPSLNLTGIGVHIPIRKILGSQLYYLSVSANLEEKDFCGQAFDGFLEGVEIK
jgi:hypothetical protein